MTKYMQKISDEKKDTCAQCGNFTLGHVYAQNQDMFFDPGEQFKNKKFFCSDACAEKNTGKKVI